MRPRYDDSYARNEIDFVFSLNLENEAYFLEMNNLTVAHMTTAHFVSPIIWVVQYEYAKQDWTVHLEMVKIVDFINLPLLNFLNKNK